MNRGLEIWTKLREVLFIIIWWIVYVRFVFLLRFYDEILTGTLSNADAKILDRYNFLIAVIIGVITALVEIYIFPRYVRYRKLVVRLAVKGFYYSSLVVVFFAILRWVLPDFFYVARQLQQISTTGGEINKGFDVGMSLLTFVCGLIGINVLRGIYYLIGPKLFKNKMLGRYAYPSEEYRIFMFMDLENSTTIAEKLGHITYSRFLQDCFQDLTSFIIGARATTYQYVGDEVVLTWSCGDNRTPSLSMQLFFKYQEYLQSRSTYYQKQYGHVPVFKASINQGLVSVAEVGGTKREICYHGDVLNTGSRIQKMCKELNQDLLVSETFVDNYEDNVPCNFQFVDEFVLRGKEKKIKVYAVQKYC
ncbi:adenylate/guanylate cyclase domain-containing protein [Puteibacter caeruleilacunae]|nr:adenylate/guanylate cyclase domain-containing protein [Puteibacter caeruleilacunae]